MACSLFTMLSYHHTIHFQICHPKNGNSVSIRYAPFPSSVQLLNISIILSVSIYLPILDTYSILIESYNICHFVYDISFSTMSSKFVNIVACDRISLLWKNWIYSTVCTHISFICSSVDRHLSCFHFLALWLMLLWTPGEQNICLNPCFQLLGVCNRKYHFLNVKLFGFLNVI